MNAFIRAKRPDNSECTIDLTELISALDDDSGAYFFVPESGEIIFRPSEDVLGIEEDGEDDEGSISDDLEVLPLDPIPSHERFHWMEEFVETVHSVTARVALDNALRQKKPFRHFKEALFEYPGVREEWFQFEAGKFKQEAIKLVGSFDWEILEIVDRVRIKKVSIEIDPAERVAPTTEEREWILRGASEIAAKGGRSQLALLLKGSKDRRLLKHNLNHSPVYGKLSFLTIEEIENRIDHLIRKNDLRVEVFYELPVILLTDSAWEHVRAWSNELECREAARAGERELNDILLQWRQRPRHEQFHLLNALMLLDAEPAKRILEAWRAVAGKEFRKRIEEKLRNCKFFGNWGR